MARMRLRRCFSAFLSKVFLRAVLRSIGSAGATSLADGDILSTAVALSFLTERKLGSVDAIPSYPSLRSVRRICNPTFSMIVRFCASLHANFSTSASFVERGPDLVLPAHAQRPPRSQFHK